MAGDHSRDHEEEDRNAVEAGLTRGVVRSVARFPAVGRLPKAPGTPNVMPKIVPKVKPPVISPKVIPLPKKLPSLPKPSAPRVPTPRVLPKEVPVKEVARISDRVSQGLDVYDIANNEAKWKLSRIRTFATSEFFIWFCLVVK